MIRFQYKGNKYKYEPFADLKESQLPKMVQYKESGYVNIGAAFDIETTSYFSEKYNKPMATMWHWQFALDDLTITGRTWEDFVLLIEMLNKKIPEGCTLLVWVQNFSFEFQWIKAILPWNQKENGSYDVFAKADREIIYAKSGKIEFRDSQVLTQMPLKAFQKNFKTKVGKLSGDLDYKQIRTFKTQNIKRSEMAYNINDVQVLASFFHVYIKPEFLDHGYKIPLTATGIVREEMKRNFSECDPKFKKAYRQRIRKSMPSRELYLIIRQFGFRGGLVHANTSACNECIEEDPDDLPGSKDLKSAHPSHELQDPMPMKYKRKNAAYWQKFVDEVLNDIDNQGFFAEFTFTNIRAAGWHCIESKNKLVDYSDDAIFENGRLASASKITVWLMELDFLNYLDMYEWDNLECDCFYMCEKEMLPEFMRKTICHYFDTKENKPKDSLEYGVAKRKLNSTFGFCATGLVEQELQFNPKTNRFEESPEIKTYDSLTKNLLLLPQWAMQIAAGTRRDICRALKATGCDSLYYDTDSDKVRHPEKYAAWFETFNKEKIEKNKKMNTFGYDPKIFERLGCFEDEYRMTKFQVLGAKRYIVEYKNDKDELETHVTIAGVKKGSLEDYCEKEGISIWEYFTAYLTPPDKRNKKQIKVLEIPRERSGKTTTVYTDEAFDDYLVDLNGEGAYIHEESCVAIIDIPFKLNITREFLEQILSKKEERKNQIYKGVL